MEFMDQKTMQALDFRYILNNINVLTPYGKIYKNRLKAFELGEENRLIEELDKIENHLLFIQNNDIRREINNVFLHIKDLRTSIKRTMEDFILTEVELFEIKTFLFLIRDLDKIIKKYNIKVYKDTEITRIKSLEEVLDPEDTGVSTFYIYDNYSEELKSIREKKRS